MSDPHAITAETLWDRLTDHGFPDSHVACGVAEDVLGIDADALRAGAPVPPGAAPVLGMLAEAGARRAEALARDGRIPVFRQVYVPEGQLGAWLASLLGPEGGVGVCWAATPGAAVGYASAQKGLPLTLEGSVAVQDVDWDLTVLLESWQAEDEVRVEEGAMVRVHGVAGPQGRLATPVAGEDLPAAPPAAIPEP